MELKYTLKSGVVSTHAYLHTHSNLVLEIEPVRAKCSTELHPQTCDISKNRLEESHREREREIK